MILATIGLVAFSSHKAILWWCYWKIKSDPILKNLPEFDEPSEMLVEQDAAQSQFTSKLQKSEIVFKLHSTAKIARSWKLLQQANVSSTTSLEHQWKQFKLDFLDRQGFDMKLFSQTVFDSHLPFSNLFETDLDQIRSWNASNIIKKVKPDNYPDWCMHSLIMLLSYALAAVKTDTHCLLSPPELNLAFSDHHDRFKIIRKPVFCSSLPWLTVRSLQMLVRTLCWTQNHQLASLVSELLVRIPIELYHMLCQHLILIAGQNPDNASSLKSILESSGSVTPEIINALTCRYSESNNDLSPILAELRIDVRQFVARVDAYCQDLVGMWRSMSTSLPNLPEFSQDDRLYNLAMCRMFKIRSSITQTRSFKKHANRRISEIVMGVPEDFFSNILDKDLGQASLDFINQSKDFDSKLTNKEIFQASRNAWTCFALQTFILGIPVHVNDCVLGYSLLYPYTDNYLDDVSRSSQDKLQFQERFRSWITQEFYFQDSKPGATSTCPLEEQVETLVQKVHDCAPGKSLMMANMAAILDAQTASLEQHNPNATINDMNVFEDITVIKGGTSVLTDVFAAGPGNVSVDEEVFAFSFGVALQIVDDMQDVLKDLAEGQHTIFTILHQSRIASDFYIIKTLNMLSKVLEPFLLNAKDNSEKLHRQQLLNICNHLVIKNMSRSQHMCSKEFIAETEKYAAIPFASLVKMNAMRYMIELLIEGSI